MTKFWRMVGVALIAALLMMPGCASAKKGGSETGFGPDMGLRAPSAQGGQVVFSIGPESYTDEDIKTMLKAAGVPPSRMQQLFSNKDQLKQLIDGLVDNMVMEREASSEGLDRDPEVQMSLRLAHMQILSQAYQKKFPLTDADLQKYYDAHKDDYLQVQAQMLMTKSEADGKKAATEARKPGANFDEVAKKYDDNAKKNGKANEAKFMRSQSQQLPEDLDKAIFSLKDGDISDPINVQSIWILIKVVSHHQETLDEAKDGIRETLKPEMIKDKVKQMRQGQSVKVNDDALAKMIVPNPEVQSIPLPPSGGPGSEPPKGPPEPKKGGQKKPGAPNSPP